MVKAAKQKGMSVVTGTMGMQSAQDLQPLVTLASVGEATQAQVGLRAATCRTPAATCVTAFKYGCPQL
jgi:hypothetical protein